VESLNNLPTSDGLSVSMLRWRMIDPLGRAIGNPLLPDPPAPDLSEWTFNTLELSGIDIANPVQSYRILARVVSVEEANCAGAANVVDAPDPSRALHLGWARPNPFASRTRFLFAIHPGEEQVVRIYGVDGRLARILNALPSAPGMLSASWDGLDEQGVLVRRGVYAYRIGRARAGTLVYLGR
jgi:hypothetical protein